MKADQREQPEGFTWLRPHWRFDWQVVCRYPVALPRWRESRSTHTAVPSSISSYFNTSLMENRGWPPGAGERLIGGLLGALSGAYRRLQPIRARHTQLTVIRASGVTLRCMIIAFGWWCEKIMESKRDGDTPKVIFIFMKVINHHPHSQVQVEPRDTPQLL